MLRRPFCRRYGPMAGLALAYLSTLAPTARAADSFDPMTQVGPNPVLPEPQQYLFPPMHLARVVGWKEGETPTVAPGLKIEALAHNLEHPRSLYVLPNGDILAVESRSPNVQPIRRPKDIVMGLVESWVTSGGKAGESVANKLRARFERAGDFGERDGRPLPGVFTDDFAAGEFKRIRRRLQ